MMSDKWNDKDFNPKTMIFTTEGQDMFREEIELKYSSVAQLAAATPDKCKTKMSEMMGQSKRIIQNWEASGQGDGGYNAFDEETPAQLELGVLSEGRPEYALSSRSSFFLYKELYLLYLWDVAEMYDLTCSCMQTLDPGVAAGDGGANVPSLVENGDESSIGLLDSKGTKGSKEIADIAASLKQFNQCSESIQKSEQEEKRKDQKHATIERTLGEYHATKERISREIESLEKEKRSYEWELLKAKRQRLNNPDEESIVLSMQEFVDGISQQLEGKRAQLKELDGKVNDQVNDQVMTPQKSNVTPKSNRNNLS
jgi:hypothetical protein